MSTPVHPGPRCAQVFDLAADHGLPCDDDDSRLADRVEAFIEDYRSWAPQRDAEVEHYLRETRSRYRLFLPNRPSAPTTAGQMYWYFDDIVLQDEFHRFSLPIPFVRHSDCGPFENRGSESPSIRPWAENVNRQLVASAPLRGPMRDGIVLAASPPKFDPIKLQELLPVAEDAGLRQELCKGYRCGSRLEIETEPRSAWTYMRVENQDGHFVLAYTNSRPVPPGDTIRVSIPFEGHKYHFSPWGVVPSGFDRVVTMQAQADIVECAQLVAGAQLGRGAVLSERQVDLLVMEKLFDGASGTADAERRNSQAFELALPHLQGLTPPELFDLRNDLPDAFAAFRAQLTSYCLDSRNLEHAQSKAEELTKLEKELEASLRAKLKSNRIIGYGSGAISAGSMLLGALGITFLGPALPFVGILAAAARSEKAKQELMASPACFIWNAKRKSRS